jgi:8-oxo-dGTP pyrophosphatase MutT (NUDIX family)
VGEALMSGNNVDVEAAGGVLWRPTYGGAGVEVALVHRPKYDDWSLPKGKLEPGEHPLLGGLREIEEETGARAVPGRPVGETRYTKDGLSKRVRYWAMRYADGDFVPNDEVDQVMWLPPREALAHLMADRDGHVLKDFLSDLRRTRACLVVRHGSAGDRETWAGDDVDRPLDRLGRAQAEGLVAILAAYEVTRARSADVLRCLDTLGPFAARARLTIDSEPLLSERGFAANPSAAAARVLEVVAEPVSSVICTQRGALPGLVVEVCRQLGGKPDRLLPVRKGGSVVLHVTDGVGPELVAVEQLPPNDRSVSMARRPRLGRNPGAGGVGSGVPM